MDRALAARVEHLEQAVEELKTQMPEDRATMVVFSGDLDKVLAAFVTATGAAAAGLEASMFFTFWGLCALEKENAEASGLAMRLGFQPDVISPLEIYTRHPHTPPVGSSFTYSNRIQYCTDYSFECRERGGPSPMGCGFELLSSRRKRTNRESVHKRYRSRPVSGRAVGILRTASCAGSEFLSSLWRSAEHRRMARIPGGCRASSALAAIRRLS